MSIRLLPFVALLGFPFAYAAPPKEQPAPTPTTQDIDVDAMARAKDVRIEDAPPAQVEDANKDAAPAAAPEANADAAAAATATPPTDAEAAANEAEQLPLSPLAPKPTADVGQQRLAAACEERAKSLLDAAQKGDYAAATHDFDARMRSALPPEKFGQAWQSLAQFGALSARGQSHPAMSEGYIAVTIPLIFEKKNLMAQVACGSDGRIAGFYVKPLDVPGQ